MEHEQQNAEINRDSNAEINRDSNAEINRDSDLKALRGARFPVWAKLMDLRLEKLGLDVTSEVMPGEFARAGASSAMIDSAFSVLLPLAVCRFLDTGIFESATRGGYGRRTPPPVHADMPDNFLDRRPAPESVNDKVDPALFAFESPELRARFKIALRDRMQKTDAYRHKHDNMTLNAGRGGKTGKHARPNTHPAAYRRGATLHVSTGGEARDVYATVERVRAYWKMRNRAESDPVLKQEYAKLVASVVLFLKELRFMVRILNGMPPTGNAWFEGCEIVMKAEVKTLGLKSVQARFSLNIPRCIADYALTQTGWQTPYPAGTHQRRIDDRFVFVFPHESHRTPWERMAAADQRGGKGPTLLLDVKGLFELHTALSEKIEDLINDTRAHEDGATPVSDYQNWMLTRLRAREMIIGWQQSTGLYAEQFFASPAPDSNSEPDMEEALS